MFVILLSISAKTEATIHVLSEILFHSTKFVTLENVTTKSALYIAYIQILQRFTALFSNLNFQAQSFTVTFNKEMDTAKKKKNPAPSYYSVAEQ